MLGVYVFDIWSIYFERALAGILLGAELLVVPSSVSESVAES